MGHFTASILRIRSAVTFSYILSVLVFEVIKTLLEAVNEWHQRPIDPLQGVLNGKFFGAAIGRTAPAALRENLRNQFAYKQRALVELIHLRIHILY